LDFPLSKIYHIIMIAKDPKITDMSNLHKKVGVYKCSYGSHSQYAYNLHNKHKIAKEYD